MSKLQKLLHICSWVFLLFAKLFLAVLGLFVVPVAIALDWPKIFWLWYNDEEGCPNWWFIAAEHKGGFIAKFPQWWWFAIRNPVNNSRFIFKQPENYKIETNAPNENIEPHKLLEYDMRSAYRWNYSGPFAGFRYVKLKGDRHYNEFWIGWKMSKIPGMGFTSQLRLNRLIGT